MASVIRGSDNFDSVYAKPKAQCTAWATISSTPSISDGYNIATVTYGSDNYNVTFTTPMQNTNYTVVGAQNSSVIDTTTGGGFAVFNKTTSGFSYRCPSNVYNTNNNFVVYGGLN